MLEADVLGRRVVSPSGSPGVGALIFLAHYARAVPDTAHANWPVLSTYWRPPTRVDSLAFVARGGEVLRYLGTLLVGVLPDAAIPLLYADPAIRFIETDDPGCFAGVAG